MADRREAESERTQAAVSILLGLLLFFLAACGEERPAAQEDAPGAGPPGAAPPAVTVAEVEAKQINEPSEFVGRVEAIEAVDLRARVSGFVQERLFEEGEDVKVGQLLFVIEPDEYEAQLASAQAQLAMTQANLQEAERELARNRTLFERGVVAQATLDTAIANAEAARAEMEAAEAAVRSAELDLDYTRITAPIAGRIGRALVSVGSLVGPDAGPLARIVQLEPIRVVFSLSEAVLVTLKLTLPGEGETEAELAQTFVPEIRLPNGVMYPHEGRISFIDNEVDPSTGTIAVRALFPNPQGILLPGQFVTVVVRQEEAQTLPVVPAPAVQVDREGRYVLVLDHENRVEQRRVVTGDRTGQGWAIEQGLKEGERVIIQGMQKVQPGMAVTPQLEGRAAEGEG